MPNAQLAATEPADRQYIELVLQAYTEARPTTMLSAVAYATHSGVAALIGKLQVLQGWNRVRKRWLVGIDFCRSDPLALQHLDDLPRSEVHIFDGTFVVGRKGCVPRTSFHPKLYMFQRNRDLVIVAGSGNLSRTGLCVGIEAGVAVSGMPVGDSRTLRRWFDCQWRDATPLKDIHGPYEQHYGDLQNRKNPVPTEDDAAPESAGKRGQLSYFELRKLNVCNYLWVQAGNLHANRGPGRPGNQLMLKRNTRVFFGFPARDLEPDTAVGQIEIEYGGHVRADCSLRFSNNSMDVLGLPIPGAEGPAKYDQETLCFERTGIRRFRLSVGSSGDVAIWRRRSKSIDGYFKMRRGREWGVF